jgi:hypothetical protein
MVPQSFSFPLASPSLSLSCSKSVLHLEAFTQLADLLESQLPRVYIFHITYRRLQLEFLADISFATRLILASYADSK